MVTEVIEIIVRDRGTKATSKNIKKIGFSAKTAQKSVVALGAALATVGAFRALKQLAKDAVSAQSEFEQLSVRLGAFLGSQEEANKALDTFVQLSAKTPFAVSQIVEGASALASAALGNRERLEELTKTAANLAAVSGLSFEQAASNLARALNAGIASADLFRDRGITPLIESIAGVADATKLSAAELEDAFSQVFGETGQFGQAAENLSKTLGGALSNIGDAANIFQVELGKALAPAVINTATQVMVPFFQNLQLLVKNNAEAITQFAAGAISGLIKGFVLLAEVGLSFLEGGAAIRQFIIDLTGAAFEAELGIKELNVALTRGLDFLGLAAEGELESQIRLLELLKGSVDAVAEDANEARNQTNRFTKAVGELKEELGALSKIAGATNLAAPVTGPAGAAPLAPGTTTPPVDPKLIKDRVKAEAELGALQRRVRLDSLSSLDREVALIDEQIARARTLGEITGQQIVAQGIINDLLRERAGLLLVSDEGGGAANFGEQIGNAFRDAFEANVDGIFEGDIKNSAQGFAQDLGSMLRENSQKSLKESLFDVAKILEEPFSKAFEKVGEKLEDTFGPLFEGLGEEMGKALGAGLQFAASLAIDAILGGTNASQRTSVAGVQSAITSTQAVRGIVSGPRDIAVAQVGDSIIEANAPLIELDLLRNIKLDEIVALLSGRGLGAGGLEPNLTEAAFGSGSSQA